MKKILLSSWAIAFLLLLRSGAAAADSENLVNNGGFEEDKKNWEMSYKDKGTVEVLIPDGGSSFLRLSPTASAPPEPLAMQQQLAVLPAEGAYLFRAKLRANSEYSGKLPVVQFSFKSEKGDGEVVSGSVTLQLPEGAASDEWVNVEQEFQLPENVVYAWVFAFAYGTQGAADYDDVEIVAAE